MAEYADFTELFDKEAYDADKKAQADAIAQAKAEARIAKAEQKAAKEAKAEDKIAELYDKSTGKQIAKKEQIASAICSFFHFSYGDEPLAVCSQTAKFAVVGISESVQTSSANGGSEPSAEFSFSFLQNFDDLYLNPPLPSPTPSPHPRLLRSHPLASPRGKMRERQILNIRRILNE